MPHSFDRRARRAAILLLVAAGGCAREEIAHGLDELQVNEVLVALDEEGVAGEKRRDEGGDAAWRVDVPSGEAARARRVLSERDLPRTRPPGFGQVFGKGSLVPSATEERALYLHALSGELARTVEAVDGVVAARVHLALAQHDPARVEDSPPPRASVLVKARTGARAAVEALAPGLRSIVCGAVPGLDPAAVSVVVTDSAAPRTPPRTRGGHSRVVLLVAAALAGMGAILLAAWAVAPRARIALLRARRRRSALAPAAVRVEPRP